MDSVFVVLIAVVTAAIVAALILLLSRREDSTTVDLGGIDARTQQFENELASLREAKSETERKLAAEEQKAARIPELERILRETTTSADTLRDTKAEAERQLATSTEIANQTRETLTRTLARIAELEGELRAATARIEVVREEKAALERAVAETGARLQEKADVSSMQRTDLDQARLELGSTRKELAELRARYAKLEETLGQEMKQADAKLTLLREAKEQMNQQFRVLAEEVMKNHGETFSRQNKEQLDGLLTPLKDRLVEFQNGLQTAHTESAKERATLAEQIRTLTDSSATMSKETHNLTQALKGKAQTQGAWGEMILATILDRSGLRNGEEYTTQESHSADDGGRLRPDVTINLPNGERVIIDSKVSLTAFEAYVNATDDAGRAANLSRHLTSVRTHIKTLSSKEYQHATGNGVDFVIMFIPIEGALAVALQQDPSITAYAAEAHVAIATPTTLMMALRTVASLWQVERRNQNAEAIAERAGKLYDKFVGFVGSMQDLGKRLGQAQESYGDAVAKLSSGRGNLVSQVEALKLMGAKTARALPATLLNADDPVALPAPATVEEEVSA